MISDLVFGASRREGSGGGALGFIVALAALIVVAIALLVPVLVIARRRSPWSGSGSPATAAPSANTPGSASSASRTAAAEPARSSIDSAMPAAKKLVLTYVDSLRTDMLRRAIDEGRAPNFAALLERGVLIPDCVSSFPSVTPVACSEMVTGVGADRHWISGMNWYHRLERRYVEYGSSLDATRAFGVFRALYDLVYNMNLAHLSPEIETLFESLDDAGERTACTPFLIYRGRHRHEVSLDGLMRRAVDATKLKFHHHTWGPTELFYGDLYASREVPCKSTSIPGIRDDYAACCAAELVKEDHFDFLLLSLPDNDNYSHRHGPEASVESIARADDCFAEFVEAAGGLDALPRRARADPASPTTPRPTSTAACRWPSCWADEWSVLQPSDDRPELAQLAVSPTGRAAHVYLLPGEGERADAGGGRRAADRDRGRRPGLPAGGRRGACRCAATSRGCRPASGEWAVVERGGEALRFRPGGEVADLRGGRWELEGEPGVLEARIEDGVLRSEAYPDPLARVWSALSAPHAGDFVVSLELGFEAVDWGGVTHAGGGSHGALHAGDSLGPLLFVGCGPGVGGRARAVDAARRRAGRPRALRAGGAGVSVAPAAAGVALGLLSLLGRWRLPAAARPRRRPRASQVTEAEAIEVADRDPKVVEEKREQPGLWRRARTWSTASWEVAYFADDKEVALVIVDAAERRSDRVLDRVPGRLEDGPRLLGAVRPQAQRALRLPAALPDLPDRPGRLAPAAGGSPTSTCWSCSASASPTSSSTGPRSASRCRSQYPVLALPPRRGRCGSGSAAGGRGCGRSGRRPGCWSRRSS